MDFKGNLLTGISEDCGFLWISIELVLLKNKIVEEHSCVLESCLS